MQLRSSLPTTKGRPPGLVLTSFHLQIQPRMSRNLSLSPGVLDQLVARVADEVTRRLPPPEVTNANPVSDTTRPSALSEVPLVSAPPAAAVQVPGLVVANQGMAGTIVQRSLGTTHTSLSGEVQVPEQLSTSPSLPIDARVSEKLRTKIWNNEVLILVNYCLTQFLRRNIK